MYKMFENKLTDNVPLDYDDANYSNNKSKKHQITGPCYLKMLVNNGVAGSIIGKSGNVIASVEKSTGCRLKLSPSSSYYPNTQDRVLIISGELYNISDGLSVVLEKCNEYDKDMCVDNKNTLTCVVLVPKLACPAIIGKGGEQIKVLQEFRNVRIHISPKDGDLAERTVSIIGAMSAVQGACMTVVEAIQKFLIPKAYTLLVYDVLTDMNSLIPATGGISTPSGPSIFGQYQYGVGPSAAVAVGGANIMNSPPSHTNIGIGGQHNSSGNFYKTTLISNSAFLNNSNQHNMHLVNHQLIQNQHHLNNNHDALINNHHIQRHHNNPNDLSNVIMNDGNNDVFGHPHHPHPLLNNMIQREYNDILHTTCEISLQIPDACVGAIIGKNGNCLAEIIQKTGARVQISQKGEFVDDTTNRKVTIFGVVSAVHEAHILLLQGLNTSYHK